MALNLGMGGDNVGRQSWAELIQKKRLQGMPISERELAALERETGSRSPDAQASPGASASMGPVNAGMSAAGGNAYFDKYKDVADAYAKNSYGMTPDQFAKAHYDKFGQAEGRVFGAAPAAQQGPSQAPNTLGNPFAYEQKNPYLDQMSESITSQVTDNLNRNIMPGIRSSAVSSGNFGGSRQGVVEANALKDANQGLSNALTGMRFGDYNNTMGRQLQRYGQDQSYNLGLGNLALGNKNSDQGFYTQQRGQDLQQVGLGASLFGQGNQGMLNQGQGIYNLGLTGQQAPWQSMNNFGNVSQPYTGFGSSSQNQSGSAGAGFLGGALAGSQAYNIFGGNSGPMGVQNTGGFTNTPNYLRF